MSTNFDWMNFIDISGPFLSEPVLNEKLPHGLDAVSTKVASQLRKDYEEWREAVEENDPYLSEIHDAWIHEVLCEVLEYDDVVLRREGLPENLKVELPEYGIILKPDMVLCEPTNPDATLMLLSIFAPNHDLNVPFQTSGLVANAKDRMISMLKASECSVGLVTNGEMWMLVFADDGSISSTATWHARMFSQERETLRAFSSLLGIYRFTGPATDRIGSLLQQSIEHQGNVTEELGAQVSAAIEVLMRALDRADQDRNRELLKGIEPKELYEAGLTLMMRLVVVLCAEERDLLLLGDPIYDAHYAISTMRSDLVATDPAILSNSEEAWSRLLATFRLIFSGSDHPDMRLAALGGSLFDPDKYPFLEGRPKGSTWESHPSSPLPIDDRTVLLLLDALQSYKGRKLSYKALDVEQIGHVYEGLLEQSAYRVKDVSIQLKCSPQYKTRIISLSEIESLSSSDETAFLDYLAEKTGRLKTALSNDLAQSVEALGKGKLITSCRGDTELADRILPFINIVSLDTWGMPLVYKKGSIVLMRGMERRESGSHYTPKAMAEKIVNETLLPVVFSGPAAGVSRKDWVLKTPREILELKICDPAMGSGAFLVQICRWLADQLVKAWADAEKAGLFISLDGTAFESLESVADPLSDNLEERIIEARRLIAERCLYGVDINPLAVELAKLSLWLTTAAKGRPFGFLDHNLKNGDSLLGIESIEQLVELDLEPVNHGQLRLFGRSIRQSVGKALELRTRVREHTIIDIEDVKLVEKFNRESRKEIGLSKQIADAFVGCVLSEQKNSDRNASIEKIAILSDAAVNDDGSSSDFLKLRALTDLAKDSPNFEPREPFHWPLEFPEVFQRENGGFDAIVGNPPFIGGQRISGSMGSAFRDWLVTAISKGKKGSADLVAYFFIRSANLIRNGGCFGLLATKTIAEGDTRKVGLEHILKGAHQLYSAAPNEKWPGAAAVFTSRVHAFKGTWKGAKTISGHEVDHISAFLSPMIEVSPNKLKENSKLAFQGCITRGLGFVIDEQTARKMLEHDRKNKQVLFPYLNGQDLNTNSRHLPSRWVINFWDWPEDIAQQYELPFYHILNNVKDDRHRKSESGKYVCSEILRNEWWLYEGRRKGLFEAIGRNSSFMQSDQSINQNSSKPEQVICFARVSKYLVPIWVPNDYIYSDQIVVCGIQDPGQYAQLYSSIFEVWTINQSSSVGATMRFTPSDCLETFPFLKIKNAIAENLAKQCTTLQNEQMQSTNIGITEFMNNINNEADTSSPVELFRSLKAKLDQEIINAYGWTDINLNHGFYDLDFLPKNDCTRFTISQSARDKIISRLANLNQERFSEQSQRNKTAKKNKNTRKITKKTQVQPQDMFQLDTLDKEESRLKQLKEDIVKFLTKKGGYHGKVSIFSTIYMRTSEWENAIKELESDKLVMCRETLQDKVYAAVLDPKND